MRKFFGFSVLLLIASLISCSHHKTKNDSGNLDYLSHYLSQSNKIAEEYSRSWSEVYPEMGSGLGYHEFDTKVSRLDEKTEQRAHALLQKWQSRIIAMLAVGPSLEIKTDLRILLEKVESAIQEIKDENDNGMVPLIPLSRSVFYSISELADEQNPLARKAAAVDRFNQYVNGFTDSDGAAPSRADASRRWTERKIKEFSARSSSSKGKLFFPLKAEVEDYLKKSTKIVSGLEELLKRSGRNDWQQALDKFKGQVTNYDNWIRKVLLPRARKDHRVPIAVYTRWLRDIGLRSLPQEVVSVARAEYKKKLQEYADLAKKIATRDGLSDKSPKAVIAHLKKSVETDPVKVRARYEQANAELSADIVKRDLVSLPKVPLRIRLASEAESAIQPVPHLTSPALVGNKGERPEFVVPVGSREKMAFDDFSFSASAKSLTAHEGRPGHDLQFSSILDNGVSLIRAQFAFNSVNVEGWALYAEWLMEPSLSEDEKMALMMARVMRNVRMFVDPELELGLITPKEVKRIITEEVGMSPEWADLELQRYMFRSPGQATSYYYGYLKLRSIRDETQSRLGSKFRERCFHDAILAAGLMPLDILEERLRTLTCE